MLLQSRQFILLTDNIKLTENGIVYYKSECMLWQVDVVMLLEIINYFDVNKGCALETMYEELNSLVFCVYFIILSSQKT